MEDFRKRAPKGKRWCYDCIHYYTDGFCGYNASNCYIYGSLDCDQKERHPDRTADTCKDYTTERNDYNKQHSQPKKYNADDADLEFQNIDLSWLDNI